MLFHDRPVEVLVERLEPLQVRVHDVGHFRALLMELVAAEGGSELRHKPAAAHIYERITPVRRVNQVLRQVEEVVAVAAETVGFQGLR